MLLKLAEKWNNIYKNAQIDLNMPVNQVWSMLKENIPDCNTESCWLEKLGIKRDNEKCNYFSPNAPKEWQKNPNEWLSNFDISNVVSQYEKKYKCFKLYGPTPIDFDKIVKSSTGGKKCICNNICNFNIDEHMKKGIFKIGIIFNTDPHDKSGEHWISLFINLRKKEMFFFDSAGDKAPKEVMNLVKRIQEQGRKLNKPMEISFDQNHPIQHQKGSTECGMYSLYFIIHLLEDMHSTEYYKTHILDDKYIEKFRKIYFN